MPQRPPTLTEEAFEAAVATHAALAPVDATGKYRHWETLRRMAPPDGLTHETWWASIKIARGVISKSIPLVSRDGEPRQFAMPDPAWQMLHHVDQQAAGHIGAMEQVANPHTRSRYIISSLIEEAITSSQLEGASTTRLVAKQMLRSGRQPQTKDERMIFNNFRGMDHIRTLLDRPLTPNDVLGLHRILTEGTLDDPEAAGRLQHPGQQRVGVYDVEGNLLHQPPPADQLPERLEKLCAFANGELGPDGFLHPVVRSILVHYWLAYDHPFQDGNGRTARALFYWSMLRNGYWLAEFLSISRILRKAPAQYGRSFLYTDTDDGDTTYFILFNLRVICRAIEELHDYLERKTAEVREIEHMIRRSDSFNHRQLALLGHALRHPGTRYTFLSHAQSHGVTHEAARKDLHDLAGRGLLAQAKRGRQFVFEPAPGLEKRLREV